MTTKPKLNATNHPKMFFAKESLLIVLTICTEMFCYCIFQSFKFWPFLKPLPSIVQNGSKFVVASLKGINFT